MLPAITRGERIWQATFRSFCGLVFFFLVAPILVVIPLSFTSSGFLIYPMPGISLRWYDAVLFSPIWSQSLLNTGAVAIATTILATALGTLAALGVTTARLPFVGAMLAILISPFFVPLIVTAVGLFYFYASIGLTGTFLGLIMAHTTLALPFVFVTVTATLVGYDRTLSRAGASLGATPLRVFLHITLPTILPGILSGALFAFATSLDEVVVTTFLTGPTIPTLPKQILKGTRENLSPAVAVVATFLIVLSVVLMLTIEWLRRRGQRLHGRPA
jgi:putative spermidine/putrescine transport system permease protein